MPCRFELGGAEAVVDLAASAKSLAPAQIRAFVAGHFDKPGLDLVRWAPTTRRSRRPAAHVQTPELQEWGRLAQPLLGAARRATAADVTAAAARRSCAAAPVRRPRRPLRRDLLLGLVRRSDKPPSSSTMAETARGMVLNALHQVREHGLVPNGARVYGSKRCSRRSSEMALALARTSRSTSIRRPRAPGCARRSTSSRGGATSAALVAVEPRAARSRAAAGHRSRRRGVPAADPRGHGDGDEVGRTDAERVKVGTSEIAAAPKAAEDFSRAAEPTTRGCWRSGGAGATLAVAAPRDHVARRETNLRRRAPSPATPAARCATARRAQRRQRRWTSRGRAPATRARRPPPERARAARTPRRSGALDAAERREGMLAPPRGRRQRGSVERCRSTRGRTCEAARGAESAALRTRRARSGTAADAPTSGADDDDD